MRTVLLLIGCWASLVAIGCASYSTPGPAADMRVFGVATEADRASQTEWQIKEKLELKPLAEFPTAIAVARVQGRDYRSYTVHGYGRGRYTVVTTRDIESDEHFERLEALPLVTGVAPMNRLILPESLESDRQLREAAAMLRADMLLIYTLDTDIYVGNRGTPVDIVTFGILPHKTARVTTTASAALLDTRNGYVYGLAEATAQQEQGANTWNTRDKIDEARRATESQAFAGLIDNFERTWAGVLKRYAQPAAEARAR